MSTLLSLKMSTRQSTKQTKKVAPQFDLGFVPTNERQINYEGTKELDPIADRDMRLEELSFIASQKKKLTEEENKLKNSFLPELLAELEDSEENPKIRHTAFHKMLVTLTRRSTYRYTAGLVERREKLEKELADLKAEEKKQIRHGEATLVETTNSIRFSG